MTPGLWFPYNLKNYVIFNGKEHFVDTVEVTK